MTELTKGFTCECGTRNEYPAFVFAYWNGPLVLTCQCGRRFRLFQGRASKISNPAKGQENEKGREMIFTYYQPFDAHSHTPPVIHPEACQGRVPVDPYGFEDCREPAICTWNGVAYCSECAPERPCDGEYGFIQEILAEPILGERGDL